MLATCRWRSAMLAKETDCGAWRVPWIMPVPDREKAFRDKDPQDNRQRQGAQGDAERQPRMIQHPAQPAAVDGDHPFEETLAGLRESVLLTQRFVA